MFSGIGINYGTNGDNLPSPQDAIHLSKRCNIQLIRLFEPNHDILDALRHSGLLVTIGVVNDDIPGLASGFNDPTRAREWLESHITPYEHDVAFQYITIGNEVIPGPYAMQVAQAMNNMHLALQSLKLGKIKVTTVVSTAMLETSYPPSAGEFRGDLIGVMGPIITYLWGTNTPLLLNVYPYFGYAADPSHISLEYATFLANEAVVIDGDYKYFNLFDATVDAVNVAIEKVNVGKIGLMISESGWPSLGNEPYASKVNAQSYNTNLLNHVKSNGTPRRPDQLMDVFIFALFNENQKAAGVEQNFGVFYPDMEPVYPLFSC